MAASEVLATPRLDEKQVEKRTLKNNHEWNI